MTDVLTWYCTIRRIRLLKAVIARLWDSLQGISSEGIAIANGHRQPVQFGDFFDALLIPVGIMIFSGLLCYGALVKPARGYGREHSKWIKAKAMWEELYYCYHCDSVCDTLTPVNGMSF
jgi:hypothetical protein